VAESADGDARMDGAGPDPLVTASSRDERAVHAGVYRGVWREGLDPVSTPDPMFGFRHQGCAE
jgi:hypothetical protein